MSVASDAARALDLLREAAQANDAFQIALLDSTMPGSDGEALGKQIRSDPQLASTRLVFMTRELRVDTERLAAMGFAAHLTKPIRVSQLLSCLASVFSVQIARVPKKSLSNRVALGGKLTSSLSVLVVEDNMTNQQVALAILQKVGVACDVAQNGLIAIEALRKKKYHVVLMDLQMPEMGGIEATREIRASTEVLDPKVPIIAMTARVVKGDREACLAAGMDDYISKPLTPAALVQMLEKWLERSGAIDAQAPAPLPTSQPVTQASVTFAPSALLDRLMGDREVAQVVLAGFLEDIPGKLEQLLAAVAQGDALAVERLAHTIKGAAAAVSGELLAQLAEELEVASRARNLQTASAHHKKLLDEFARLRNRIEGSELMRCVGG